MLYEQSATPEPFVVCTLPSGIDSLYCTAETAEDVVRRDPRERRREMNSIDLQRPAAAVLQKRRLSAFICYLTLFAKNTFSKWRRLKSRVMGISPNAKGTLFEYLQPQGHQLNVLLPLVSLQVLCACARLFDHPSPNAPSLSRCPQLSTSVRDHRGKSFVPAKWAVLPSVQFQPRPSAWGGGPMEVRVAHPSPNPRLGLRGPER